MHLFRFQHLRGSHLLLYERHREEDQRGPRRPQGQHAGVQERGDDRRHPESVSAISVNKNVKSITAILRVRVAHDYAIHSLEIKLPKIGPHKTLVVGITHVGQ